MTPKSDRPFVIHPDCVIHSETGQKLHYLRIVEKIANPRSLAVVVEFDDAASRRRKEEMDWSEFRSWPRFYNKMMSYGYRCINKNFLELLHDSYMTLDIPITLFQHPASGWCKQDGIATSYYVPTNKIIRRSLKLRALHKGSYAQPLQYGSDLLASDIASWDTQIAPACGRSPAQMVAILSALAATLLPAIRELPSFCLFYGSDEARDREVIRCAAASVFGAPHNFSILGKSPTPLQLVADFRHGVVCCDIPSHATEKQILAFFRSLLGINGEISGVSLPSDMRLLALATGPHSHIDSVPRSISVSGIVDPELKLYDSLPDSCTPEQMNSRILFHAQRQKGGVGLKFTGLIEKNQSEAFGLAVARLINDFTEQLQPKTNAEKTRAQAVALLWAAGRLGIDWQMLPWKVDRLEGVLKQLFAVSCKSLPDLRSLEEAAVEKLRQYIHEAKKLNLNRRGHKLEFTAQQVAEADLYLEDNYMYIRPALLSQWLPDQEGKIAISCLDRQSLLEKNLPGRLTKTVQKTILRTRDSFYGINIAFLDQGFPANPEVVEADGSGDEVTVAGTEPLGERLRREFNQYKAADQSQMDDPGVAPVGGGSKVSD